MAGGVIPNVGTDLIITRRGEAQLNMEDAAARGVAPGQEVVDVVCRHRHRVRVEVEPIDFTLMDLSASLPNYHHAKCAK